MYKYFKKCTSISIFNKNTYYTQNIILYLCIYKLLNGSIYIYTYPFLYIHVYVYICIYMYAYICIYAYMCMYAYICMYVYTCIYVYILCNLYINLEVHFLIYFSRCNAGKIPYFSIFYASKYTIFPLIYLHYIWRNK